jgi:hypothetical protein
VHTLFLARFAQKKMKRIIIEVEDLADEPVVAMLKLCNGVKIVSVQESMDVMDDRDACMRYAINTLRNNKVFRYSFDYAWIMMAMNEGVIDDFKCEMSLQGFIDYLKELGFKGLPCRTSLYNAYAKTLKSFPEWKFVDVDDAGEILRRKNVVVQFMSAYGVAKRGIMNMMLNK